MWPCCRYPRHFSPWRLAGRVPGARHPRPAHHSAHQADRGGPRQPRLRDSLSLTRGQPRQPRAGVSQPLSAAGGLSRLNNKCHGENINKCCNREKKISNGQQQQSVIRVTPALCQWWIPQLRPGCPVNTTELPQSLWLPSPRPHCANFIYDEGVKLKWFYIKTYIDTYVVYSTFYLTIIIAIFVFRDANCKSSIKLSLLSLVDIFVSHYQISDRFGWSGV